MVRNREEGKGKEELRKKGKDKKLRGGKKRWEKRCVRNFISYHLATLSESDHSDQHHHRIMITWRNRSRPPKATLSEKFNQNTTQAICEAKDLVTFELMTETS